MSEPRLEAVWTVLERYVRGERTDAELRVEARGDPDLGPLEARTLRCGSVAQELLEALDRSPFDDTPGPRPIPTPTRDGVLRWLERVRDGHEDPVGLCDWATDALAWHDPDRPMDPAVQELLAELSGSEDDVRATADDPVRMTAIRAHLEADPAPDAGTRLALGLTVCACRDELLVALVTRTSGVSDDDALRAALRPLLADHTEALPDVLDDLVAAAAELSADPDDLDRVERFLDRLARTGDPNVAHGE